MKIRLGYVSISKTLNNTSSHTITYTNYQKIENKNEKLIELAQKNINNLKEILNYNIKNNIHFYRMTSNLFPLYSHKEIKINYLEKLKEELQEIGNIIKQTNMRVDIHLDEYTVLNSVNSEVVNSTINIINFFKNMFKYMDIKSHMIIHIGGSTFGKEKGIERFIKNFKKLDKESQKLIIIENDDKIYNIKDVLNLCQKLNIPMVLDYHHYICNNESEKIEDYIIEIFKTWKEEIPKIHFSSPKNKKEKRSHHDYIDINEFIKFIKKTKFTNTNFDIMIEAKEKDNALFNLTRLLKYNNIKLIDETTIDY